MAKEMSINERIRMILDRQKIADKEVAKWLGISAGRLSQKFKEGVWDSVAELKIIQEKTGYDMDWLVTGNGDPTYYPEQSLDDKADVPVLEEQNVGTYLSGKFIRPITVTVDRSGKELISYVQVKAFAGYRRGFGDPHYIEKLPAFNLPNLPQGKTLRMFQVDGESMLQLGGAGLHDGDVVIGEYVEDIFSLRDNRVYVIVSTEGVLVKRVINRLTTEDKILVLKSDNKNGQFPDIIIHPKEILEVWELKAFISRQLSFSTDLWNVINDLQVEQALIRAKVNEIARGTSAPEITEGEKPKNKRIG